MKQRTKVAIGLAAAGALAGVVLVATSGPRDPKQVELKGTPAQAQILAEALPRQPWLALDAARRPLASRYRLDYAVLLKFSSGHEALGLRPESRMAVVAQLELAPAAAKDGADGWVAGRLLDVQLSGDTSMFKQASLPLDTRMLLVASAIFIDLLYFERKK